MKSGIELIAEERQEQIQKHGKSRAKDVLHTQRELRDAAMFALTLDEDYYPETWGDEFLNKMLKKQGPHYEIERLKIAGALIAAEIDRIAGTTPLLKETHTPCP